MSPLGQGGRHYPDLKLAPTNAQLVNKVLTATTTLPAFLTEDATALLAALDVKRLGTQEVQKVVVKGTAGTWTLKVKAQGSLESVVERTTAKLKWNASAAEVQAALEALDNVDVGDVVVTGGPGNEAGSAPYVLTWNMGANVEQVVGADELTGGEEKVEVSTTTAGDNSGSLKLALETFYEGNWWTVAEFTELTAATEAGKPVAKVFSSLGTECRWKVTLGAGDGAKVSLKTKSRRA